MGQVKRGMTYANNGVMFELRLDRPTPLERQAGITQTVLRVVDPLSHELIPMSFIPWTDGTVKASVVFRDSLSDDELRTALSILLARLVELDCLDAMPVIPVPLCVQR